MISRVGCSHHLLDRITPGLRSSTKNKSIILLVAMYCATMFYHRAIYTPISSSPIIARSTRMDGYFTRLVLHLINIHPLYFIFWNLNTNWRGLTVIWIITYFQNRLVNLITRRIFTRTKGKNQVERPHQNLEYIQDIPHHRKVLVPHHYCNPDKTYPLFFVNGEGYFVETEKYI